MNGINKCKYIYIYLITHYVFTLILILIYFIYCLNLWNNIYIFSNGYAMGFCETIRRTGAVGSSLELMGGWYFGYILMGLGRVVKVYRLCCCVGISVMLGRCPRIIRLCCHGVSLCYDGVSALMRRCAGYVAMVFWLCCDGVSIMLWYCFGYVVVAALFRLYCNGILVMLWRNVGRSGMVVMLLWPWFGYVVMVSVILRWCFGCVVMEFRLCCDGVLDMLGWYVIYIWMVCWLYFDVMIMLG